MLKMRFGTVDIPDNLSYTNTHLWVKMQNGICILGWTDYIQENAGDVIYLELADIGTPIEVEQEFGSIETSKWVDKLYSPLNGRVVEVNKKVTSHPEVVNEAPFTKGWFVKIELQSEIGFQHLMSPLEYFEYLKLCEVE
jgi:glycine cleavage system H protein